MYYNYIEEHGRIGGGGLQDDSNGNLLPKEKFQSSLNFDTYEVCPIYKSSSSTWGLGTMPHSLEVLHASSIF